ncbi:uncharacterized protein wu:fb74b10 [Plectropomus leopardus]|uniref:uncharacterized protein wu:fb74b10 n=1 Tax=Plectropomus leopardus TaxID=160734 RepID=UPI001C4C5004|nr:uncharacterized protein wu:fb74b10 [Plectropomus leopardus]
MAANDVFTTRTRWTRDMEDLLVDLWKQYECLYDVSSDTYHNKLEKERCWEEIAVALDLSVEEVKVRATSLRTQYTRVLKPLTSGSGKNKALTPRQRRILKSLKFLRKHVNPRSSESNVDQTTKDTLTTQLESDGSNPENTTFSLDLDSGRSHSPADKVAIARTNWSVEKENKLLQLWQQHPCLYEFSADRFHDRLEREKKWTEIATTLDLPVEDVKIRATSLRTQYSKLVKPLASGKMRKPITGRQRMIMTSCEFLKKHITHRPTEGKCDQLIKDELVTQQDSSESEPENTALSQDLYGGASPSPTESSSVSPPPPPQLAKKEQDTSDKEGQKLAFLQHILDVLRENHSKEPQKDCEDAFGVTVAMELKRIRNPALRNRVKRQIMTVLYDALDSEQVTDPLPYQPHHAFQREDPHSITVVIP